MIVARGCATVSRVEEIDLRLTSKELKQLQESPNRALYLPVRLDYYGEAEVELLLEWFRDKDKLFQIISGNDVEIETKIFETDTGSSGRGRVVDSAKLFVSLRFTAYMPMDERNKAIPLLRPLTELTNDKPPVPYVVMPLHLRWILDDDMEVYCEDELDYLVPPEYLWWEVRWRDTSQLDWLLHEMPPPKRGRMDTKKTGR